MTERDAVINLAKQRGFGCHVTEGGIETLKKDMADGRWIIITERHFPSVPDTLDTPVEVGFFAADGTWEELLLYDSLAEALDATVTRTNFMEAARKEGSWRWVVDFCPDADGHSTIRVANGEPNGNTDVEPIATVYEGKDATLIAVAPELANILTRLTEKVERANSIQHGGGKVLAEDWSELYQLTNEARAILVRTEGDKHE